MKIMKIEIMKRIRSFSIETLLIFVAIGVAMTGFTITIMGAFLNGLSMFNGSKDLSKGFGIILIGDSIALLGLVIMVLVFVLSIFKLHCGKTENNI